jgi:pSer/pThr/pTyr-binding forkhead associated (FHA) protein
MTKGCWGRLFCFNTGQILEMNKEKYTVGRLKTNDIRIADPAISSVHFTITQHADIPMIYDSSRNGTVIHGKKIQKVPLLDKSEILIQYDHYFVFLLPNSKLPLLNDKFSLFDQILSV